MNLGRISKRRQNLQTWQRKATQLRLEMEEEYPDDRPLFLQIVSELADELGAEETRLHRAARGRFSHLHQAACRVQSPEEP